MRRIKSKGQLKKEGLITSILKSETSNSEHSYMNHFNTNVDTNDVDINDDTYDAKIEEKIKDIRVILSRLGDKVTINDRVKIKKELYEIENKKNLLEGGKRKYLW